MLYDYIVKYDKDKVTPDETKKYFEGFESRGVRILFLPQDITISKYSKDEVKRFRDYLNQILEEDK